MTLWRHPHRVVLALFASGVLGTSLAFACLYRDDRESIFDIIRADVIAGATAQAQLQFSEAEQCYRRVIEETETATAGSTHDLVEHGWALVQLGDVLEAQGRIQEAERYYTRALERSNPNHNPYDESAILPLSHLRDLYASTGDIVRAEVARTDIDSIVAHVEPIYLRAIAGQRRMKKGDRSHLADNLMRLANLYYERGDLVRAEPLYAEIFEIRSRKGASGGGDVLGPLGRMGLANADAGKNSTAAAMLKEALAARESQYGPTSPYLIKNLYNLGMLAYRRDRLEEADSLFSRALAIEEACLGMNHPYSMPLLAGLADCNRDWGRFESARAYQLRLVQVRSRVYGPDSRMVAAGLLGLARIEAAAGDRVAAREMCAVALELSNRAAGMGDPLTLECESTLDQLSRYMPDGEGDERTGRA